MFVHEHVIRVLRQRDYFWQLYIQMFRTLWGIRYILPLQKMPAIFKLPPEGSDPIRAQMKRNYDEYQIKRW